MEGVEKKLTVVVNIPTTIGLRMPGVVPSVFEMPNKRPAYLEKYVQVGFIDVHNRSFTLQSPQIHLR